MRILIVAMALALLTVSAHAQGMGTGKGKKQKPDAQKTEDQAKKKADEKSYQDALKRIPASNEKSDPWKSVR
jgi:aryl-alcohol dehydrogenase-like predicted oxidoreductase